MHQDVTFVKRVCHFQLLIYRHARRQLKKSVFEHKPLYFPEPSEIAFDV